MDPTICFALGVIPTVLSIFFLSWYFSDAAKLRRAMRDAPIRRVGDVLEGEVARVVGEVEPLELVEAPLSGRACVYWQVLVQEYRNSGKSGRWVTVIDEDAGEDFLVRDVTGKALVKVAVTSSLLDKDYERSSGFMNDATPELEAFLAARGERSQGWVLNKRMRYREGVVEPGERVCVVGVGRWERDPNEHAQPGQGYRDAQLPQRLILESPQVGSLLLSDEPAMVGE
jgi:hypothetical protein